MTPDEQAAREYASRYPYKSTANIAFDAFEAGAAHARKAALAELDRRIWAAIDPSAEGVARQCAEIARRVINEMLAERGG